MAQAGNGAAIKRLDALALLLNLGIAEVVNAVAERRKLGIVALEPGAQKGGRVDTRCRVRFNVSLDEDDD